MLLSSVVVNTVADSTDSPGSGVVSLRDAIATADSSTSPTTITFDPTIFASAQTIVLNGNQLNLTNTTEPTTITGPTVGVTISGNNTTRVLQVNTGVTASISGVAIVNGNSGDWGGGVLNSGFLTLINDTISNNFASYVGGGIYNSETAAANLILIDVTLANNSSASAGGGLFDDQNAVLTNVTVSGNSAPQGGGIVSNSHPEITTTLNNVTVSNNVAVSNGGGIWNEGAAAQVTLGNTIVAGNTVTGAGGVGPDADGGLDSLGHNLIGKTDGSSGWISTDLTGTLASPLSADLGSLANNGGLTQTLLPQTGSPAIDGGSNALIPSGITTDQRGLPRISNGTVDIGAVEVQTSLIATTTAVTSGDANSRYGLAVTFTATVTPSAGSGETGTVQFQIDGSNVGNPVALSGNTAMYTTSTLSPGTHSIDAVYSGDSNFVGSTSPTFSQTIAAAATTTTAVTSSNADSTYGLPVYLLATVTPSAGPTGTVQFQIDGSNVGNPVALSGNTATYTTSTLGAGTHSIVAIYSGDNNFVGSTSTTFAQSVAQAAASTAVTSSNSSPSYGQPVTFTATVTPITGSGETGTVQFQIDGSNVGSPVALSGNTATYKTSTLSQGSHSIVAVYSGDTNFSTSTSPTLTQNVTGKAATTMAVTAGPLGASVYRTYGLPVTLIATVTPSAGSGETGTVQFQIDGSNVGSPVALSDNYAIYTTSTLGVGTHSIIAIYSGDVNFSSSTSPAFSDHVTQVGPWGISTLASFNGTNGSNPEGGLTADASGNLYGTTEYGGVNNDGTVFELSGTNHQTLTTLVNFNGTNGGMPAAGLTFDSSGNLYGTTWAGGANNQGIVFELSGTNHQTLTTLASFNNADGYIPGGLTVDASGNLYGTTGEGGANNVGTVFELSRANHQTLTTLANFHSPGVIADTAGNLYGTTGEGGANGWGAVFELSGTNHQTLTWLASFSVIDGTASSGGALMIDAAGNLYGTSRGDYPYDLGVVVFEVTPDTAVTSSIANPSYGQPVTFTATVAPIGTGPTGTVQFQIDGSNVGSPVSLTGNTATYTTSTLSQGSHSIVAVYSGDANFTASTSPALIQNVATLVSTTTAVISSNASPTYGQSLTFTATVTPSSGSGETGTVQFQIDGSNVGSPVALSGNTATYTTSTLSAGSHSIVAIYSGDANFATSTSGTFTQSVAKVGPGAMSTLASFNGTNGSDPRVGLLLSGGTLYGETNYGGADSQGTVFSVPATGGTPTVLASFNGTNGNDPVGPLVLSGSTLYGMTADGGVNDDGTVFSVPVTGGTITVLMTCGTNTNGADPETGLILSGSTLYGALAEGGVGGNGMVFSLPTTGGTPTVLASFPYGFGPNDLILSGGTLYGAVEADPDLNGEVFSVPVAGGTPTVLASFNDTSGEGPFGLILSGGTLYGETNYGGADGAGTVFSVPATGGTPTVLASLNGNTGGFAIGPLILSGGTLYGETSTGGAGGADGAGTVFSVPATGGTPTVLVSFTNEPDPHAGLILSGSILYGTLGGNNNGDGTVFELTPDTAVTSSNDTPSYGQPVTFTATVTPIGAGPTGTVQFQIDGSNVGSPETLAGNTATYSTSTLSLGYHSIVAVYSGDNNFSSSTSLTLTQNVAIGVTATAVTSSNAAPSYGQPVTFTATVTPNVGAGPTGTVQFQIDGSYVGSPVALSGNTAAYTTSTLSPGSHSIVAIYSGDGNFAPSTSTSLTQYIGTQVIDIPAGDVLLSSDLSSIFSNCTLRIENGARAILGSNQHIGQLQLVGNGTLDLGSYSVFINYGSGPDPIASIAASIANGYASGAWTGTGIMSTMAQTNSGSYGIGYADSADPGNPADLPSGTVEIMYTLLGDANLDGKVNGTDFNILAANFNTGGDSWDQGDFNYDGKVNGSDFNVLAANFNQGISAPAASAASASSTTAVTALTVAASTTPTGTTTTPTVASTISTATTGATKAPAKTTTSPKSKLASSSKAVVSNTKNNNPKAPAVKTYAAGAVTVPSAGSAATPLKINKGAKFLANR